MLHATHLFFPRYQILSIVVRVRQDNVDMLCELQSTIGIHSVTSKVLATPVRVHLASCFSGWGVKMEAKEATESIVFLLYREGKRRHTLVRMENHTIMNK